MSKIILSTDLKKDKRKIDNLILKKEESLSKIRRIYNNLSNDGLKYLRKKTKTRTFNTFLKYLGFSQNVIKKHDFAYKRCVEANVFYYDNIKSAFVPDFLGISKSQYNKIKETELLATGYDSITLYGRYVKVPYYDILSLVDYYIEHDSFENKIKSLLINHKGFYYNDKENTLNYEYSVISNISKLKILLCEKINTKDYKNSIKEKIEYMSSIITDIDNKNPLTMFYVLSLITKDKNIYIGQDKSYISSKNINDDKEISITKRNIISHNDFLLLHNLYKDIVSTHIIKDPFMLYDAMNHNRTFKFILGDTNSGKTHEAMQHLLNSRSGVYLSPLRLLAHEKYEEMKKKGIKVSMWTGEQKIETKNNTHTSCTIEMLDIHQHYDVAIIDEIQMINDNERGQYWMKALLSVNADTVYILGSQDSKYLNIIFNLLDQYDIKYTVDVKKRLSTLEKESNKVNCKTLEKGDAIVTFDKNTLFSIAHEIQKSNRKCSVLFGELDYDKKIEELNKFKNGESDFIVSTDAIAMGMNLPIKRILFYKTFKYNGNKTSIISNNLFKQIIGRAGRYKDNGKYGIYCSRFADKFLHQNTLSEMSENNNYLNLLSNKIKLNSDITINDENILDYNYKYDFDLLIKIKEKFNLSAIETLISYNESIPFKKNNIEKNIRIYKDIDEKLGHEALFKLLSINSNACLFNFNNVLSYYKIFKDFNFENMNINNIFELKILFIYLKFDDYYKKLEILESNIEKYSDNWCSYIKDYSFSYYL